MHFETIAEAAHHVPIDAPIEMTKIVKRAIDKWLINYFYTIFFLCLGLICLSVIGFKWILKQYLKIANDRRTLALQGVFFLTLGLLLALTTPLLFKEWSERLWSILTFALGIGFFLRGLLFIFAQTIIQKVLSFYLFKTPVSIALISALLFFVLAILTATRDYVGETQNLESLPGWKCPRSFLYCFQS